MLSAFRAGRALRARAARLDPNEFCEFVLRDEKTHRPVAQAPHHIEMQAIWTERRESVIWAAPESGKSNAAVGRVLWELGHQPYLRVCFVSKTTDQSEKLLQLAKQYVENSSELHEVFPRLRKSKDRTVPNHRRAFTAERDSYAIKDPSIRVTGLGGNILGARVDLIVMDDWLDFLSTRTEAPRESAFGWARSNNCFGRLTDGGRIWVVTNAWHPQDANERLVAEAGFYGARFPSVTGPLDQGGQPTYPERWTRERLEREVRKLGPLEFVRTHLCMPRDDGSQVFRKEWLTDCMVRGDGAGVMTSLAGFLEDTRRSDGEEAVGLAYQRVLDEGGTQGAAILATALVMQERQELSDDPHDVIAILHGVDLAVEQHSAADLTAIVTIAVYRNGDRRVLRVKSGRWDAPKIIDEILAAYWGFGGTFIVENAGQQGLLIQMTQATTPIPCRPFKPGTTKANPQIGIQAMAAEVYSKKWIIPSSRPQPDAPPIAADTEIEAWTRDMLVYDPTAHTGDRLVASHLAYLGALELQGEKIPGLGGVVAVPAHPDERGQINAWLLPHSHNEDALEAVEQTLQALGMGGARFAYNPAGFRILGAFGYGLICGDPGFVKFACERQGYAQAVTLGGPSGPTAPVRYAPGRRRG